MRKLALNDEILMKIENQKEQYRINEKIRVREVRLVGDNVEQGVYSITDALNIAEEQGIYIILVVIVLVVEPINMLVGQNRTVIVYHMLISQQAKYVQI